MRRVVGSLHYQDSFHTGVRYYGTLLYSLTLTSPGHLGTIESLANPQTYTQQSTHQTPEILLPTFIPRPLFSVQ